MHSPLPTKRVIISLGSNIEPRRVFLAKALDALSHLPHTKFLAASSIIETEGIDVPEEFAAMKFLNQVAVFSSSLDPFEFSRLMHKIEDELGRVRLVRNGPRTIDIDMIKFGDEQINTPELIVPHPRAAARAFVTIPLKELGIEL